MTLFPRSSRCPDQPSSASIEAVPIAGSLTFQHLILIISWSCFGISILLWLGLVIPHLRRYSIPNEQRQIFRITSTPLVFSIFAVISIHLYDAAEYLESLPNLYEAYALASLFLLYVNFVAPDVHTREEFFHKLEQRTKSGEVVHGGSLRWFVRTWRTVFFYILIYTILVILGEILLATNVGCVTSTKPGHAHIWIQALELIATIWAIIAVVVFQRRLKSYMVNRKALPKLIVFKLFVLLTTLQHFVFNILKSHVKGTSKVTYWDITVGIPSLLICVEGMLFMAAYYFAFHSKEYQAHQIEARSISGMGLALLHALNPMDLVRGIALAFGSFGRSNHYNFK